MSVKVTAPSASVGPGVQDGSVGVPELEAELAVGENSAEEPLGGAIRMDPVAS